MHDGQETYLAPRLLALLTYFVEHRGEVLSRDRIVESVWGHLDAATDDSVNVAVSSLRRELGDTRRPHRVILAIPRRGYRFDPDAIAPIEGDAVPAPSAPHPESGAGAGRAGSIAGLHGSGRTAGLVLGLLVVVAAVIAAVITIGAYRPDAPPPPTVGNPPADSTAHAAAPDDRKAVAVLPFLDMTPGGDHGPFADGLADRIIHMLTLSPDLDVTARTSSFAFRDASAGIGDIAERLDVDVILEGSVQRADDQIRVLAQLIDADTEMHLWSRSYDRPAGELFALQDDIANEVARTMTDTLLPGTGEPAADSQQVWELITRGRLAMDRFTLGDSEQAVAHFDAALALQPDNVDALIGLVDAIGMVRSQGPMRTAEDREDFTEEYLERARRLAPDSSQVVRALGDWHFRSNRPEQAIETYRRAVALNPNDATAHRNLGRVLFRMGRFDDATESLRKAVQLDPLFGLGPVWLADAFWAQGRAEEALFRLRRFLEERPGFAQAHDRIATYLAQSGQTGQAMRHIVRAHELDPDSPGRRFSMCEFWLQIGDDLSAEACTNTLAESYDLPFRIGYLRQIIHGFRGEWDAMERELEAIVALGNRDPLTPALLAQSYSRHDCPRALALLEERFPVLFDAPSGLTPMMLLPARTAIHCLQQTGRGDRAETLLASFSDQVERTRTEQGPWLVSGIETAWDHALHGRHEQALVALEELVEDWRYYWWGLDYYPEFAPIRDTPRFRALMERLERGVAEEREYFEAHRDAPLT
ncbi:tetratricopeptide repeat protein [Wenzhouxiangella sp. XN79A]|uniref:tetratricopeptide repeat protein n=1 Tax=Wenzhouxiangella sp. XN79A TaxID=2724193 RepID=UPI00144ADD41|nr:tetratricopeptide repeat protein [Wenzhouxiangella sp. XN79A]